MENSILLYNIWLATFKENKRRRVKKSESDSYPKSNWLSIEDKNELYAILFMYLNLDTSTSREKNKKLLQLSVLWWLNK